jgi:excisionase family DNA binding protein
MATGTRPITRCPIAGFTLARKAWRSALENPAALLGRKQQYGWDFYAGNPTAGEVSEPNEKLSTDLERPGSDRLASAELRHLRLPPRK